MENDGMLINSIVEKRVRDELARIECSSTNAGWERLSREINDYVYTQSQMYGNPSSTRIRNDIYNLIKYVVGVNSVTFIEKQSDIEKARKIFEMIKELKPCSHIMPKEMGIYRVTYRDKLGRHFTKHFCNEQEIIKSFMHLSNNFTVIKIELI